MIALLVCGGANQANAQIIQRPERAIRGLFGNAPPPDPARTHQELFLSLSSLGGYDDNPTIQESGGLDALTQRDPGYTAVADAGLRYWIGREARSFEMRGHAYMNSFRSLGITPLYGGDLHAQGSTAIGRRHRLDLLGSTRSDPVYTPSTFGPLRNELGTASLPDHNPSNGFAVRRSWMHEGSASLVSRWSPRDTLTTAYAYSVRDYEDNSGDGHGQQGSLDYTRLLGRRSSLRSSYRHSQSEFQDLSGGTMLASRPLSQDAAEFGYQHERRFTRTRRFFFSFGGGATYVTTVSRENGEPLQYTTPSGYASTRLDLAQTWSIWGDYRRGVSVLEGLSTESFVTDALLVRVGGFAGSRSEVVFSTAYSNGAAALGLNGTFNSYTTTAQLRYLITRSWAATTSYTFYEYRIRQVEDLPRGFANHLARNAVRVGMTLDLPIFGSTTPRSARPAGGR